MPRGDGTGPPGTAVLGQGEAQEWVGLGGKEWGGSRAGAGPGGECMCPECGMIAPHEVGTSYYFVKCPICGSPMVRK